MVSNSKGDRKSAENSVFFSAYYLVHQFLSLEAATIFGFLSACPEIFWLVTTPHIHGVTLSTPVYVEGI